MANYTSTLVPILIVKNSEYLSTREILILEGIVVATVLTILIVITLICKMRRNQRVRQRFIRITQLHPQYYRRVDVVRLPDIPL